GLPHGSEILARVEAERRGVAEGPAQAPVVPGAVRLTRILPNLETEPARQLQQRVPIRSLAVQVHRDERRDRPIAPPVDYGPAGHPAVALEVSLQRRRVHRIRDRL